MTWKMFRRFFEEGLKKENFFPADGLTNLMEQVILDAPIVLAYDTFSGSYFEMFGKGRLEDEVVHHRQIEWDRPPCITIVSFDMREGGVGPVAEVVKKIKGSSDYDGEAIWPRDKPES